ncbi:MAG TPA: hypothetical protein VN026_10375 [Bacteroidia bacterium]|jgi:hypothetical protein|nr:hypothetical protein [Bacteroidia bacterium]
MKKKEKLKKVISLRDERKSGLIKLDKSLFNKETIINLNNSTNRQDGGSVFAVCASTGLNCNGCISWDGFTCNSIDHCYSVAATDCWACGEGDGTLGGCVTWACTVS